jgi:16S rRNA processing protein RimM
VAGTGAPAPDDLVLVGTIERPHGLRGEVVVNPLTDFGGERFVPGATLTTARAGQAPDGSTSLRIDDVRWHKDRPLVLFEGVETDMSEDEKALSLSRPGYHLPVG